MGSPDYDETQSSVAQHNLLRAPLARLLAPSRGSQDWEVTSRAAEVVEVAAALILSPQARTAQVAAVVRKYICKNLIC